MRNEIMGTIRPSTPTTVSDNERLVSAVLRARSPRAWGRLSAEPRALPAARAGYAECARPAARGARAPGGGDSVPLLCGCAKFRAPQPGQERQRAAAGARKLGHLESFTLWWPGAGRRKRDPRGARRGARAAGRARAKFPLWVVPLATSAVLAGDAD